MIYYKETQAALDKAKCNPDNHRGGLIQGHQGECATCWAVARAVERCAKIAEVFESPFSQEFPAEAWRGKLQNVILQALLSAPSGTSDDTQPERTIAEAVFAFLQTGRDRVDELFKTGNASTAIRAEALRREPEADRKMPCSFCGEVVDPEGHRWECERREPPAPPDKGICGVTHAAGVCQRAWGHSGRHSYVTWPTRREPLACTSNLAPDECNLPACPKHGEPPRGSMNPSVED
jgi:hypothetical protein